LITWMYKTRERKDQEDKRAARKGRNPQTGKEIKIAARKVPKWVCDMKEG
jgi:nucleoid DNA-binding protein